MQSQSSETRHPKRTFSLPGLVLGIAVFALAVNFAFAQHAIAEEQSDRLRRDHRGAVAWSRSVEQLKARAEAQFAEADANDDGRVSAEEFVAADLERADRGRDRARRGGERAARADGKPGDFEVVDADGNGQISPQEFEARRQAQREARRKRVFERVDADGDGFLSPDEFPSRAGRLAAMDANGDGIVDRDEIPRRRPRG